MQQNTGIAAAQGLAQGRIVWYEGTAQAMAPVGTPGQELEKFRAARESCIRLQAELYEKALAQAGEEAAAIFDLHGMLLQEDLEEYVLPYINKGESAAEAARHGMAELAELFRALDDDYMRQRSEDMTELGQELAAMLESGPHAPVLSEPGILAAEELFPGQAVSLQPGVLLGVILRRGGTQSHMAILARSMGIPLIFCPEAGPGWNGYTALLNGGTGTIVLDPGEAALAEHRQSARALAEDAAQLESYRGRPTQTASGRPVALLANIGSMADLPALAASDAEGVGLFRSEFLYLEASDWPDEDTQYAAYAAAGRALPGKTITVRTFDLGADKTAPYMHMPPCSNPALSCRGLRFGLKNPALLKTQLRAVLRAAAEGPMAVMFPLVCTPAELDQALALLEECRAELSARGLAFGEVLTGCMAETPAAVLYAAELAKRCRFLSIGTNDLHQYTFACDREGEALYDPGDPALLRMIGLTVQAAHAEGCLVNVCGQLAADPAYTKALLALGVDGLSVPPGQVLPMRRHIAGITL